MQRKKVKFKNYKATSHQNVLVLFRLKDACNSVQICAHLFPQMSAFFFLFFLSLCHFFLFVYLKIYLKKFKYSKRNFMNNYHFALFCALFFAGQNSFLPVFHNICYHQKKISASKSITDNKYKKMFNFKFKLA